MDYNEFSCDITQRISERIGEEGKISKYQVPKNNGISLEAVAIMKNEDNMAPTFYLNEYYEYYKEGYTIEELADDIVEKWSQHCGSKKISIEFFKDIEKIRENIFFKVVHYQKNRELLETIPHKKILDLAQIYYYKVAPEILEGATVLVKNQDLKHWKMTQEKLEEIAMKNTIKQLPVSFQTMGAMMEEIILSSGCDDAKMQELIEEIKNEPEDVTMYVLTNSKKYMGAGCIFYPGVLESIAMKLDSNFFVLPSSIHEVILIPDSGRYSIEELEDMVNEINETQVAPQEVLSDIVYYYDSNLGELY